MSMDNTQIQELAEQIMEGKLPEAKKEVTEETSEVVENNITETQDGMLTKNDEKRMMRLARKLNGTVTKFDSFEAVVSFNSERDSDKFEDWLGDEEYEYTSRMGDDGDHELIIMAMDESKKQEGSLQEKAEEAIDEACGKDHKKDVKEMDQEDGEEDDEEDDMDEGKYKKKMKENHSERLAHLRKMMEEKRPLLKKRPAKVEEDKETLQEDSYSEKMIMRFIQDNERTMGEYLPTMKLHGENSSTKHLNISWDVLRQLAKLMKRM